MANVWLKPDQMSAAASYLNREWGDYGYCIEGVESPTTVVSLFRIVSSDGSRFTIGVDRWGNCRDWDTPDIESDVVAEMHSHAVAR